MNSELLPLLSCPACPESDLSIEDAVYEQGRVFSGNLTCSVCGERYPVLNGIPRFLRADFGEKNAIQRQIAKNFGDAWQLYAKTRKNPYTEAQFLNWIIPLAPESFENKIVLDLGCGLAGFAEYAATYRPRQIIGLDVSAALDSAILLLDEHPNLSLVQADLLHPPFKSGVFDLIYSIGVLHHLDSPEAGFKSPVRLLKPQGRFFAWVYGRENNGLVVHVIDPLRRFLSQLPVVLVRFLFALPLGMLLWLWMNLIYCLRLEDKETGLPYAAYFKWLRPHGFFYTWGMATDQLIPPRTFYLSKSQIQGWLAETGLKLLSINPRNNMSWRVLAENTAQA